jgi:DNA-binding transcriptional MerR regulator
MSKNSDDPDLWKDKQLCRVFGIARSTLWAWRKKGIVPPPSFSVNGRNYTFPHVIQSFLSTMKGE